MKILHISDTHGRHHELGTLPDADILVHSGDFTMGGSEDETYDFMNWLCDLPYQHKIVIAGNHDDCMHGADGISGLPDNVHYLCNSGVEIEGVRFYGIPLFMADIMDDIYESFFDAIPLDTDVLITHEPPSGILDLSNHGSGMRHYGNSTLMQCIKRLHLHYHLFGHEHDCNGIVRQGDTVFSNAALLDHWYKWNAKPRLILYR